MINKASFKSDIFDAVIKLSEKTGMKVTGVVILNNALIMLLAILPVLALLGTDSPVFQLFSNPQFFQGNPDEMRELLLTSNVGTTIFLVAVIALFVGAWGFLTNLQITNAQLVVGSVDFTTQLVSSFNKDIFRVVGLILLFYVVLVIGVLLTTAFAAISSWLAVFAILFFVILMLRFTLVFPAMFVGQKSFTDALNYSFTNITWRRALKMLGVIILTLLVMLFALMIVGVFAMILLKVPFVGVGINYLIQWTLVGVMATLGNAALVGLYYRYEKNAAVTTSEGVYGELPSDSVE